MRGGTGVSDSRPGSEDDAFTGKKWQRTNKGETEVSINLEQNKRKKFGCKSNMASSAPQPLIIGIIPSLQKKIQHRKSFHTNFTKSPQKTHFPLNSLELFSNPDGFPAQNTPTINHCTVSLCLPLCLPLSPCFFKWTQFLPQNKTQEGAFGF